MIADLVLTDGGSYWRKRVELPAAPPTGQSVVLLVAPRVIGVVAGSATPFDGDGSVAAVLLRAEPAPHPAAQRDALRRDGWSLLV